MASPNKIQNKPYRNWVKGALGLSQLQEGLHPFTDRVVKAEHTRILQNLTPCSSCTIKNVLPNHAKGKICIHKSKAKCNCKQKTNKACNTCGNIYDEIILQHNYRDPIWDTDCSSWCTDHWQFAKCFLTTAYQSSSNTAAETDAAGLLSIIINGSFFQTEIQCNIHPPNDVFSKVRAIRNEILHGAKQEITDNEVTGYLTAMVTVLQDQLTLINDPSAQAAVKKLKKTINDDLVITTTVENKAVQIALDAITKAKQQTDESIKELLNAKTAEIQSSVSAELDARYEPELKKLKLSHEDLENRFKAFEREKQERIKRQLENTEERHKKRSDFLKQKQELQQHLVCQYQTHYVKTCKSPLMTQYNNVDIEDVYVPPDLVVEEIYENMANTTDDTEKRKSRRTHIKKTGESGNFKQTKVRHLCRYCDIFNTNDTKNKKIYVIGDVGTGKSSFLKMMMQNWCTSVTSRENNVEKDALEKEKGLEDDADSNVERDDSDKQQGLEDDADIQDISAFEFLFYIPLRLMSGSSEVLQMIKSQLPEYQTLLDEILVENSECCLILLDGLDEWSPPEKNETVMQHVTYGIPASFSFRNATIITTSRPYARGVLDMKLSECDLHLTLMGIKKSSVQSMIKKYMRVTPINQSSSGKLLDCETCEKEMSSMGHLHKTPMLLQQMIWMHCRGYELRKSISYINTNYINILFAWVQEKKKKALTLNQASHLRDMKLPKLFDKYERCQQNHQLILLLGNLAYDTFVAEEGSAVVFGRSKLKQLRLSDDDMSVVLQFGILVEEISNDPTYEKSQISFIHTSFLEFFTAIFIASSYQFNAETSQYEAGVLEKILNQQSSSADVLRLQNVLIMVCGLSPFLTKCVFECIYMYQARMREVNMQNTDDLREEYNIQKQIQDMCFQCLSECNCSEHETSSKDQTCLQVKLHDLIIENDIQIKKCLSKVIPIDVQTFHFTGYMPWSDYSETLSDKPTYFYKASTDYKTFSHEHCSSLSSFLSQALSLRTLSISLIECKTGDCEGHSIDLSNHKELTSLHLYNCHQICVCGVNSTCLTTCRITYCKFSHVDSSSLSSFLSEAVSLKTLKVKSVACSKGDCEGHRFNLSQNKQMTSLRLDRLKQFCVSGENNTYLTECAITRCEISHDLCSSLSSFLSQALSLRTLKISSVKCTKGDCDGHSIDLSSQKELSILYLYNCNQICVCGVNNTCLTTCRITDCTFSHVHSSSLSSFLSQAVFLETLEVTNVACTKGDCKGHSINLSEHKRLPSLCLDRLKQFCVSGENNTYLTEFEITHCEISHELCSSFSAFLSQALSLRTLKVENVACSKNDCEGHCINLSNHTQLSSLYLHGCKHTCFSGENNTYLQTCTITDCEFSHDLCSSLSSFLSQAVSITSLKVEKVGCTKVDCNGHTIEISSHKVLSNLYLNKWNFFCVSGENNIYLETCEITDCKFSHDLCSSLSSFLSQAVSLRTLTIQHVACNKDDCEGHIFSLSNHTRLPSLYLHRCKQFCFSGENNTNLKTCVISDCLFSHDVCSSLSSFLSQAVSLRTLDVKNVACTKDDCEGHSFSLSNHTRLQCLYLRGCNQICVSGGNNTCLKTCKIANCKFSHDQYSSLLSFLSQAVSLKTLDVSRVVCTHGDCEAHIIDLSNHTKFSSLYLQECNQICQITDCTFSHDACSSLSSFLSQAHSLGTLYVSSVACTKIDCEGHSIDLSNHTQLYGLTLEKCNKFSVSGENNTHIMTCEITDCTFSHDQFSSSSSFLSQALSLGTLTIKDVACTKVDCEGHSIDLSNHTQLYGLALEKCNKFSVSGENNTHIMTCEITDCTFSHDQFSSSSSFLSQALSLRTLTIKDVACTKVDCEGHSIDLSNHTQLYRLALENCNKFSVSGENNTHIKTCEITDCTFSHDQFSSSSSFLSQAQSLRTLTIKDVACTKVDCEGHSIDVSNHTQLYRLALEKCNKFSVTGENNTHIKTCEITDCTFSHDQFSSSSSFLSQALSLRTLTIKDVACTKVDCEGHSIDLSNHTQLYRLALEKCNKFSVTGENNTHIMTCKITDCTFSHDQFTSSSSFLLRAISLRTLTIKDVACTKVDCEGHSIDLSNHTQLYRLALEKCNKFSVTGEKNTHIKTCEITHCTFSHDVCSSLSSFMSQAVSLRTLVVEDVACTKSDCEGHSIDLSNQTKLSSLDFNGCNQFFVPGGNNAHLENCEIFDCKVSHDECSSFASFLSQAVSLRTLKIQDCACTNDDCEGHSIDLSNHTKLSSLDFNGCNQFFVPVGNNAHLESCQITGCKVSHDKCSSLSSFLSQAVSLKSLVVGLLFVAWITFIYTVL